ncbi:MAG: hypothetical protein DRQ51_08460 [Gammaproteobacteria bacterium]|nr:MAG: hypothetical protein DRQ51_08460 [Gammaproteobacteria bacterium]
MNIIFLSHSSSKVRTYQLGLFKLFGIASLWTLLIITSTFFVSHKISLVDGTNKQLKNWQETIISQKQDMQFIKDQARSKFDAMADRLSKIQMQINNIDSIGKRIIDTTDLDKNEFNFTTPAGTGGPIDTLKEQENDLEFLSNFDYLSYLDDLSHNLTDKEIQMQVIENIVLQKIRAHEIMPAGMPVKKGYISSRFGHRRDPFTKRIKMHAGVDIAAKYGSDVISVASGIISKVVSKKGYGKMVEIKHGDGIFTRYAHNSRAMVKVGDKVKAGTVIAKIGQTGRSTGPHVHFEVVQNGKKVNPITFIQKNRTIFKYNSKQTVNKK